MFGSILTIASAEDTVNLLEELRSNVSAGKSFLIFWLMARTQTAGRGRRGRAWTSARGNLFATYLGMTAAPLETVALIGFAAGVAIAQALDERCGRAAARLKWPNDVMLDGAKAAGILLDSGAAGGGAHWFALGFGVNLAGAPGDVGQAAASLRDCLPAGAAAPEPELFLRDVRALLEPMTARLPQEGFTALRAAWLARAHGLGKPSVAVIGPAEIRGIARGLSLRGELELETDQGLRLIAAGDVHFPPPEG